MQVVENKNGNFEKNFYSLPGKNLSQKGVSTIL